jgi:hypothetical protein
MLVLDESIKSKISPLQAGRIEHGRLAVGGLFLHAKRFAAR